MGGRAKSSIEIQRERPVTTVSATKSEAPAAEGGGSAVPLGLSDFDGSRLPSSLEQQALFSLQRTVGNSAAQGWLHAHEAAATAGTSAALRSDVRSGYQIQRDTPPTTDPSNETPPKPAKVEDAAKDLLKHYAKKYLGPLGEDAKKRLAQAWAESPGGVIAAGAIVGAAGVSYLIGTKSALPAVPPIPLDFIGGPFENATIELQMTGPVTSPEGFSFKITFKGKAAEKKKPAAGLTAPNIYSYANPEAIAKEVDGPEFETEIPGEGPDTNLSGANLANIVRITGNAMLAAAQKKDFRPYVDLGELPPTPPTFVVGLKRVVDALIAAAPSTLGKIEQVNFRVYKGGELRFIPVRPSPPAETAATTDAAAL